MSKRDYPDYIVYSKTCLKRTFKKKTKTGFQDRLSLNSGQKYRRMLQGILLYFRLSLSYTLSLRSLFCLVLSGRLRQVLLKKVLSSVFSCLTKR